MKRRMAIILTGALALCTAIPDFSAQAAVPVSAVTDAYDAAVNVQDGMDSLSVSIRENTMVPDVKDSTRKTIELRASGLKNLDELQVSIVTTTDEGEKSQYYTDGCFYSDQSGKKMKYAMKPEEMLEIMNYYVYLDLDSTRLSDLERDGDSYVFHATAESLGDYADKILEGAEEEHRIQLVAVQGVVDTDGDNITRRDIQTVYTMRSGDEPQTCVVSSRETFHNPGEETVVELPDLSDYHEKQEEPVVSITPLVRTVYAVDDINVRAQNNVTSAIIGGAAAGTELSQTGYTSDGWTQIQYGGTTAYVSSEYVSEEKPVITNAVNGTMYASISVNVRSKAGTDGAILGVLQGGDAVQVTGRTNNGWMRVSYKGHTGYVSESYLTWDQPITAMGGTMYVKSELANIRSYYSTDASVLDTLGKGTPVDVTGYTPNNWIAVKYNGKAGYIYGDLLTWDSPQKKSYGYLEGLVGMASADSLIIAGTDGRSYQFAVSGSAKAVVSRLGSGESVGVYYTEMNGAWTATEIIVNVTDQSGTQGSTGEGVVCGTIVSSGMSAVTIACDDGETRTFDKSGAVIDCPDGLVVGMYVSASYYYDAQRGYVLNYLYKM